MEDNNERLALWIAFTISNFTSDEIDLIAVSLQSKADELRAIVNKKPVNTAKQEVNDYLQNTGLPCR